MVMMKLLTSTAFAVALLLPCIGQKLGNGACEEELLDVFSAVESRDKCGEFCGSTAGCGFYSYCRKGGRGSKGKCNSVGLMSSKAGFGYGIGEVAPAGAKGNNQACVLFKAGSCNLSVEKWKGNGYETYRTVPEDVSNASDLNVLVASSEPSDAGHSAVEQSGKPKLVKPLQDQTVATGSPLKLKTPSGTFSMPDDLDSFGAEPMADKTAPVGSDFKFEIPDGMFGDAGSKLSLIATQGDGSALPAWLVFDAKHHAFSGTPGVRDKGQANIKLTATDSKGKSGFNFFRLNIPAMADQTAHVGSDFKFEIPDGMFGDAGGQLSLIATQGDGSTLPAWLVFDAKHNAFSGTPGVGDKGLVDIKVTATDSKGKSVSNSFRLIVQAMADQTAPVGSDFKFEIPEGKYELGSWGMSSAGGKTLPAAVIGGLMSLLAFGVVIGVAHRWWRGSPSSTSSELLAVSEHDEELSG